MEKTQIKSSTIKAIGYDSTINELEIDFNKGTTYVFYDVPHAVYEGLMNSPSKGKFLAVHIAKVYENDKIR